MKINLANLEEVYEEVKATLPETDRVFKTLEKIFNYWIEHDWVPEGYTKKLELFLTNEDSEDYQMFGDFYNYIYDMLFTETEFKHFYESKDKVNKKSIKECDLSPVNQALEELEDLWFDAKDLPQISRNMLEKAIGKLEDATTTEEIDDVITYIDNEADSLMNLGFEDYAEQIWDIIAPLRQDNIEESKKSNKKAIREDLFTDDKFPMTVSLDTIKPTVTSYPELSRIQFLNKIVYKGDHDFMEYGEGREASYGWDEFEDPANDGSKPTRTYRVIAFPTEESYEAYLEDSAATDSEMQKKIVDAVENKLFYESKKRKVIGKVSMKEAKKALKENEVELNDYTKEMIEEMAKDDYSMNHKASASEVIDWIYKDEDISTPFARKVYNYYCDVYSELQSHSEEDDYFDDEWEETDDPLYGYGEDDE